MSTWPNCKIQAQQLDSSSETWNIVIKCQPKGGKSHHFEQSAQFLPNRAPTWTHKQKRTNTYRKGEYEVKNGRAKEAETHTQKGGCALAPRRDKKTFKEARKIKRPKNVAWTYKETLIWPSSWTTSTWIGIQGWWGSKFKTARFKVQLKSSQLDRLKVELKAQPRPSPKGGRWKRWRRRRRCRIFLCGWIDHFSSDFQVGAEPRFLMHRIQFKVQSNAIQFKA